MTPREPTMKMEKAHDVRHLRGCDHCKQIGDDRYMVYVKERGLWLHGFCTVDVLGAAGLLELPEEQIGKVTIGEVGPALMRQLVDEVQRRRLKRFE